MATNNEQTQQRRQLSMYDYFPEMLCESNFNDDIPEAVLDQESIEDLYTQEYDENSQEYKNSLMEFSLAISCFEENKFKIKAAMMN